MIRKVEYFLWEGPWVCVIVAIVAAGGPSPSWARAVFVGVFGATAVRRARQVEYRRTIDVTLQAADVTLRAVRAARDLHERKESGQ